MAFANPELAPNTETPNPFNDTLAWTLNLPTPDPKPQGRKPYTLTLRP